MREPEHERRRIGAERRRCDQRAGGGELLAALDRGEIEVLFQPQFACADGSLLGAEALARWRQPQSDAMGGEELFMLAARSGKVEPLSRHVARMALAEAAGWPAPLRLSLNVTAADLAGAGFIERLIEDAGATSFAFDRLTVEITEQVLLGDLPGSAARLETLAGHGARIALDDFGAGFCNFRYLKRLPLHCLKLDRCMIEGIGEDMRDLEVLRGIMAMAVALGLDVVAEGVENDAQRVAITREGCTAWQGFLGAEPMTAAEFLAFASARRPVPGSGPS